MFLFATLEFMMSITTEISDCAFITTLNINIYSPVIPLINRFYYDASLNIYKSLMTTTSHDLKFHGISQ